MRTVLDTNIAIYLLNGRLVDPLPPGSYAVSVISEMELLSYPGLTRPELIAIQSFLASVALIELSPSVRAAAVELRRQHRLKLPDAIVAASSLGAELITNDEQLARVSAAANVKCRSLRIK